MENPKQDLINALISTNTTEELFNELMLKIESDDGSIQLFYFDVGIAILNAFYAKTKLTTGEIDENEIFMPRREDSIN